MHISKFIKWHTLNIKKLNYHRIQQSYFWVYIQNNWNQNLEKISEVSVHCSIIFSCQNILKKCKCLLMDEWISKCCIDILEILFNLRKERAYLKSE